MELFMTRQSITPKSLSKFIYKSDVYFCKDILELNKKKEIIDCAFSQSESAQLSFSIKRIKINGKNCYSVDNFKEVLLSRHLASNIRQIIKKPLNRNIISKQLVQHLKEGTSYQIYRFDIKSFFENINYTTVQKSLAAKEINSQTKLLICSIIKNIHDLYHCGLPRGLEFSPPLAELILQEFDSKMKNYKNVLFYSRYVDDILFITNGLEDSRDFIKNIKKNLPNELSLNYNKQIKIKVNKKTTAGSEVACFEYLGYKYTVIDIDIGKAKEEFREVNISLSNSRVKKLKTKISRSLYSYSQNNDFLLLKDRLDFLTSNRMIKDKKSNRIIATGVYYNNINLSNNSDSLQDLDNYLKKRILGYSTSRKANYTSFLSTTQQRLLLQFSFVNGYKNNNYKKFSPARLGKIKDAWRY